MWKGCHELIKPCSDNNAYVDDTAIIAMTYRIHFVAIMTYKLSNVQID